MKTRAELPLLAKILGKNFGGTRGAGDAVVFPQGYEGCNGEKIFREGVGGRAEKRPAHIKIIAGF
jgi:hypothetical protein